MAAYPVYFFLGQESFLGDLSENFLTNNANDAWDDAETSIDMYDYQATAVATYNTTPASANSNTQVAGDVTKIALDVSAVRYLLDSDHSGTGMAFVKRTDQGAVGGSGGSRWGKTHGESYLNIATPYNALNTLITGRGDSMDVKGFFLSVGYQEGILADSATDAAFEADLKQFILDLRTDYGSAATPVVLDFPPASVSGFTAGQNASLVNAREVIRKVARDDANVSYVSADSLSRSNGSTKWFYTGESTLAQGTAMGKEMSRLVAGKPSTAGIGVPVYFMFGDDNCVGSVAATFLGNAGDADYVNPMSNVKTWNWSNQTWEAFVGDTNSNTSTDGTTTFGPDVSMGVALGELHPNDTVYVFKLGRNTSSLGNTASTGGSWLAYAADVYSEVVTDWNSAKAALSSTEAVVPDVRGLALIMGQEDVQTQTLADGYLVALSAFVTDYRAICQTRVDETLAVVLARMQDTGTYDTAYVSTVRDATNQVADADSRISVVSLDDLPTNVDDATLAGGGLLTLGERIANAFEVLNA